MNSRIAHLRVTKEIRHALRWAEVEYSSFELAIPSKCSYVPYHTLSTNLDTGQTGAEAIADIGFAGSTIADGAAGLVVLTIVLNMIAYTIMRYNKPRYQVLVPPPSPQSN